MAEHENVKLLRRTLEAFASGDISTLSQLFSPDVVWRVPGRSKLAGTYRGQQEVFGLFGRIMELSGGTLRVESLAICANDIGGVLVDRLTAQRKGRSLDIRLCLYIGIRDGRIVEGIDHFFQEHLWDLFWAD